MTFHLARYDAARKALAECRSVDEVKDILDKAEAVRVYARQAGDFEMQNMAAEIRLRAERRAGELLGEMKANGTRRSEGVVTAGPGRGNKNTVGQDDHVLPPTLSDLGISKDQSSRWQQVAAIPTETFEAAIATSKTHQEELTTASVLQAASGNGMAVHYSSETPEWYTPKEIVKCTVAALGAIDLDPCSPSKPTIPAKRWFTREQNGLSRDWSGRVYMNPPYGREIAEWAAKLLAEFRAKRTTEAIALVPARVDTEWFRLFRDCAVCFVDGRLKFSNAQSAAPFPSAAIYLGKAVPKFAKAFAAAGETWVRWGGR